MMTTSTPRRLRPLAVLLTLLLIAAGCSGGASSNEEAAPRLPTAGQTLTLQLPADWDNEDVTPVSHFNNNRNLNGKFQKSSKIVAKPKFGNGQIFQANRFNQNKKFANRTASKKLFNSNTRVFNQQFNQQFKQFNNFANFGGANVKLNNQVKKQAISKQNNFNGFKNFNNQGFNTFNSFGVNGFKGFNTQQFLKKPGRSSVFGWVSYEELDADLVADLDNDMMAWLASGENPLEMSADDGVVEVILDESFALSGLRGHRTIFDMDVGGGEIQRVAQQAVVSDAGDQLLTFVAGCEVECFEQFEEEIVASMQSVRMAN